MDHSQGEDFGKMVAESKKPVIEIDSIKAVKPKDEEAIKPEICPSCGMPSAECSCEDKEYPEHEAAESPEMEKIEHLGEDEELNDEELAEMLKKYLK